MKPKAKDISEAKAIPFAALQAAKPNTPNTLNPRVLLTYPSEALKG
jgi:hypothetical protein